MKQTYSSDISTIFFWIIPAIIGVSRSRIDKTSKYNNEVYAIHITPFFEIGFNLRRQKV